jgi:phage terminase small subunit
MATLKNPRQEAFAQALVRSSSAAAAYVEAGYRPSRHNASALARQKHVSSRIAELQEQQLAIRQQSTAVAVANAQVTLESLIADVEAARAKAMAEKGGASAAVSAVIAKAKLSGMWREKPELTKSGPVTVNVVWPNVN